MIKILVTGGYGLLGDALKNERKNLDVEDYIEWFFLKREECDLTSNEKVDILFKTFKPTIVIHLAAKVAGLYGNINNNFLFLTENTMINNNILVACEKYNIKRLINILSSCVFPDKNLTYPLTSDQIMNGEPHYSNEGYAISKRWLYTGSKLLSHKLKVINLIPTNLYGINDNYNLLNSHVIPGLIHRCYLSKRNNQNLLIKGSGNAQRQFMFANDFAKIIIKFINLPLKVNFNNIMVSPPMNTEITIKELVFTITDIMNFEKLIVFENNNKDDGQLKKTCDNSELSQYIDFEFTDLNKGLKKTIAYFLSHYKTIRK